MKISGQYYNPARFSSSNNAKANSQIQNNCEIHQSSPSFCGLTSWIVDKGLNKAVKDGRITKATKNAIEELSSQTLYYPGITSTIINNEKIATVINKDTSLVKKCFNLYEAETIINALAGGGRLDFVKSFAGRLNMLAENNRATITNEFEAWCKLRDAAAESINVLLTTNQGTSAIADLAKNERKTFSNKLKEVQVHKQNIENWENLFKDIFQIK